jgi:hypothetical protein
MKSRLITHKLVDDTPLNFKSADKEDKKPVAKKTKKAKSSKFAKKAAKALAGKY